MVWFYGWYGVTVFLFCLIFFLFSVWMVKGSWFGIWVWIYGFTDAVYVRLL